jgi:hypothetical protein
MQLSVMFSGSPKKVALGRITIAIVLSVLSGAFLIQGLGGPLRGEASAWVQLILSPVLLGIAIVHGRLVWQAIP